MHSDDRTPRLGLLIQDWRWWALSEYKAVEKVVQAVDGFWSYILAISLSFPSFAFINLTK